MGRHELGDALAREVSADAAERAADHPTHEHVALEVTLAVVGGGRARRSAAQRARGDAELLLERGLGGGHEELVVAHFINSMNCWLSLSLRSATL